MVTAAPSRRLARALVALALSGSAATLGLGATTAWAADPSPAPDVVTTDPVAADPPPDAPAAPPTIGSWIIGGTELEATAAKPVTKPAKPLARPVAKPAARPVVQPAQPANSVAKPAVPPVAQPAARPAAQPAARPAARPVIQPAAAAPVRISRAASASSGGLTGTQSAAGTSAAPAATAPDGAMALPFTGGHVDALLPSGVAFLVAGVALTLLGRPRRTPALA